MWIVVKRHSSLGHSKGWKTITYFTHLGLIKSLFGVASVHVFLLIFGIDQSPRAACIITTRWLVWTREFTTPWHSSWLPLALLLESLRLFVHIRHSRAIILVLGNIFGTVRIRKYPNTLSLAGPLPIQWHQACSVLLSSQVHEVVL